ncbi:hypothetical protein GC174_03775 [bacterium]|nr:hypothetical protein [bacterium]
MDKANLVDQTIPEISIEKKSEKISAQVELLANLGLPSIEITLFEDAERETEDSNQRKLHLGEKVNKKLTSASETPYQNTYGTVEFSINPYPANNSGKISPASEKSSNETSSRDRNQQLKREKRHLLSEIIEDSTGSDRFHRQVRKEMSELPISILRTINESGVKFYPARETTDAAPYLSDYWDQYPAWFLPQGDSGLVSLSQRHLLNNRREIDSAVSHEAGHTIDDALFPGETKFSQSSKFKRSYQRDLQNMTEEGKREVEYYLQSGSTGRTETLAELFNFTQNGWSNSNIQKHFPNSLKVLRNRVNKVFGKGSTYY